MVTFDKLSRISRRGVWVGMAKLAPPLKNTYKIWNFLLTGGPSKQFSLPTFLCFFPQVLQEISNSGLVGVLKKKKLRWCALRGTKHYYNKQSLHILVSYFWKRRWAMKLIWGPSVINKGNIMSIQFYVFN